MALEVAFKAFTILQACLLMSTFREITIAQITKMVRERYLARLHMYIVIAIWRK